MYQVHEINDDWLIDWLKTRAINQPDYCLHRCILSVNLDLTVSFIDVYRDWYVAVGVNGENKAAIGDLVTQWNASKLSKKNSVKGPTAELTEAVLQDDTLTSSR